MLCLSLHKNNDNLKKTVRINFFRTLESNQKLAATRIKKNWQEKRTVSKNWALWNFNSPYFQALFPSLGSEFEDNSSEQVQCGKEQNKGLHLQRIVAICFDLSGGSLEDSLKGLAFPSLIETPSAVPATG